jgi:hypothetical protein
VSEIGRLFKNSDVDDELFDRIVGIKRITESLDNIGEESLTAVLGALRRLIGFDAASVYLIDDKSKKLSPAASLLYAIELSLESATDASDPEEWESLQELPVSLSVVSGQAFGSADCQAHIVTAPMKIQERLNGLLNLAFVTDDPPPRDTLRIAGILSGQMAWAVERCQYRHKLTALYETLAKLETTQRLSADRAPQVQNLDKAHDMLISISHEVNNSLSVIIGNVQCLIMEKLAISDQSQDRLQRIESAAVRIGTINKRLLLMPALTKQGGKGKSEATVKL